MSITNIDLRPRPVRTAARIVAAAAVLLNGVPALLAAFDVINWNTEQYAAVNTFIGVAVGAASLILGSDAEGQVTPTIDPMDDSLTPLVPIANDGYED